jgi:hypothetical protein
VQVLKIRGQVDKDGMLRLALPTELPAGPIDLTIIVEPVPQGGNGLKHDFSDLAGHLSWKGDAVATQRALRDEW